MGIGAWVDGVGRRSHERAVANARGAATALSRARVERAEVELYLRTRHARRVSSTDEVRPA